MPKAVVSDLVEPIIDKQVADQAKPEAYIGLEHIPERAIRIERAGDTEAIRGMCVRFSKGDILFGKLRPNLRKSVLAPVDGLGSTEIIVLRPKPGVDPSFAGHVLRSETVFSEAERMTEGTRMPRTSWKTLSGIEIFAPSDQRAQKLIANILDAIDGAILETEALIEKLAKIRLGLIEDLLSYGLLDDGSPRAQSALVADGLGFRPPSWDRGILSDFYAEPSRNGLYKPAQFHGSGPKMAQMGSIFSGIEVDLKATGRVAVSKLEYERFSLKEGDILFGRRSLVLEGAGKSAIVRNLDEEATFESSIVRVRLDSERLLPEYAILYLSTPRAYIERLKFIRQVAVSGVSGADIADFPILRPPISEQERIVERDTSIAEKTQAEFARLNKLKATREGLRDDLLTGRKPVVAIREAAE